MMCDLEQLIAQGEHASLEFKLEDVRPESLAKELVAFSNTLGGTLLIGVADNSAILGVTDKAAIEQRVLNVARHNVVPAINPNLFWQTLDDKDICQVKVGKGTAKPYQTLDGKFLIRVGSTNRQATMEELSRLFQAAGLIHFDISPVQQTGLRDLDEAKLQAYWQTSYQIDFDSLDNHERTNLLLNADLLALHETVPVCTVGGLLMFGKQPQRRLPQSAIQFAVFDGLDLTAPLLDKKELSGALPDLIDNGAALIRLFLPNPSTINGLRRQEQDLMPPSVIREVLVNAVCHRDYSISQRRIQIFLFRDRLEVRSPGRLPNTLTLQKIRFGNSAPRNLLLLKYLDNMRYIDGLGRGVPLMIRALGERLSFAETGEIFSVVIRLG
ncbi:RNA-binding domain-containing protein [Thiorhodovibrio frisius]|uniref:Putative transcriptional regulator with HTH domain n=1 Tax=Thiorhodovibrio frisius TaxID=631362 RepID=H8Z0J1_9GAMM|nr:RNA-binding domain-containing protein [Thiorhodovibrio frisius]EIC21292.1 putative transcriptional regulator with HTH domain [Thiorhodovibrio frisius]WPL23872.1 Divergent AAA domain protein [Thiorhodovibrio frisius]